MSPRRDSNFWDNTQADKTGYGYLELSEKSDGSAIKLSHFVEKPSRDQAKSMLDAGNYLWNAGIFMFRALDMIEAFESHASEFLNPVREALANGQRDLDFLGLIKLLGWSVRICLSTMP